MKKSNKNEFIKKSNEIHNNKYDYSKVEYINSRTKVCIICPEHGEFWQTPNAHISGKQGCPSCSKIDKTTLDFINECKQIYGDKYDYSKVEYKGAFKKVCIICPEHGEFRKTPDNFLHLSECPRCSRKMKPEDFIKRSKEIHNDKYDYSKVEYKHSLKEVCIICPEHGEFWQKPKLHLIGHGCRKCSDTTFNTDLFIKRSKEIHGDKYDYSKVEYKNAHKKVCIICPKHGEFWQKPHSHLSGCGCRKCGGESSADKTRMSCEDFIKRSKEIHGDKYDYSKVNYKNNYTPVKIICHKHGIFEQIPVVHLRKGNCPHCITSNLEEIIFNILTLNNIKFTTQQKFDWMVYNDKMRLDFFIPEYNVAIECQGRQHFESIDYFKGDDGFIETCKRDKIKYELCKKHGIKIYYFADTQHDYFEKIYTDENILLNEIIKK